MRTRQRAAYGAALLYVLSAASTLACPVAADLDGAGIRFVGANGSDEVHRRATEETIDIDYVTPGEPGAARSTVIHGIYLHALGDVDAAGVLDPASVGQFVRPGKMTDLPLPEPGLIWIGMHTFTDANDSFQERVQITVGEPTTWVLGACSYAALPVVSVVTEGGEEAYRETMTYVPELGTAVLVRFDDASGPAIYDYTSVLVETP